MWEKFKFNEALNEATENSISGVQLPDDYLKFMLKHNGGEGDIGDSWLVLYPFEELQEINDEYSEDLPVGHIIIGDNGGGELFGVNCDGKYFIVPELIEEEYLEILGESIENLPAYIENYWSHL